MDKCHTTTDVWERLMSILSQKNTDDIIYVYRLGKDQRPVKPHLLKCDVFEDFLDWLRDYYGSGRYHLLIRRGRVMVFSGNIAIES